MEILLKSYKLRELQLSDAEKLFDYLQDSDILKFLSAIPNPYTKEDALSFISFANETRLTGKEYHFAISDLNENLLGVIGIKEINNDLGTCEIGYWLGKEHHGKGIISNVIPVVVQFCFSRLKLQKIKAIVFVSNIASIKVLEKTGFVNVGYSNKPICNSILKEKMYEFELNH